MSYFNPTHSNKKESYLEKLSEKTNTSRKSNIQRIFKFPSLMYRLEPIDELSKVLYINDSRAQSVDATWYSMEKTGYDLVWIAGGSKANAENLEELSQQVSDRVDILITLGENKLELEELFREKVDVLIHALDMEDALKIANLVAKPKMKVLYSPASKNTENPAVLKSKFVNALKKLN